MRRFLCFLWLVAGVYLSTVWGQDIGKPSFDCKKANTSLQHVLCTVPELADLDQALDLAYNKVYYSSNQPALIEQEQKQWLDKLSGETNQEVIKKAFQARTQDLAQRAQKQLIALQNRRTYSVLAIKRFLNDQNKIIFVKVSPYFLRKMHEATFDGLSPWLFVDEDNDTAAPSYLFARSQTEDETDKVEVNNCASYEQALKRGYDDYLGSSIGGPPDEIYYDLRDCKIIGLFKKAKPAKRSYVRDFQIEHVDPQNMLSLMKRLFKEYQPSQISDLKYFPDTYVARMQLVQNAKDRINVSFIILGWGDFDGDGLDDMLLEIHSRGINDEEQVLKDKVFIITRKRTGAPIEIVKLVDEIS